MASFYGDDSAIPRRRVNAGLPGGTAGPNPTAPAPTETRTNGDTPTFGGSTTSTLPTPYQPPALPVSGNGGGLYDNGNTGVAGGTAQTAKPGGFSFPQGGGFTADTARQYYASRGVTPFASSPDYWAQKWNEWGWQNPADFQQRLSQADEFLGRPSNFDWVGAGIGDPGHGSGDGSGDPMQALLAAFLGGAQAAPAPAAAPAAAAPPDLSWLAPLIQSLSAPQASAPQAPTTTPTFSGGYVNPGYAAPAAGYGTTTGSGNAVGNATQSMSLGLRQILQNPQYASDPLAKQILQLLGGG